MLPLHQLANNTGGYFFYICTLNSSLISYIKAANLEIFRCLDGSVNFLLITEAVHADLSTVTARKRMHSDLSKLTKLLGSLLSLTLKLLLQVLRQMRQ